MWKCASGVLAIGLAVCAPVAYSQETAPADNTKVNKQDRGEGALTADQAKNNTSDRELMQKIRRSIVKDDSLSTTAHNVKIIARNGKVTLKGPVNSEAEKQTIEQKATEVAGSGNVTNQITIKAARKSKTG